MYDGLWFEGLFTHQEARVTTVDPRLMTTTRWNVTVDHWLAGGLQEFGGDRARPFLTGLLGLTRYAADSNEIRFVVSAGGGVKLHPTRRLGMRLDGRVFATFADIDGRAMRARRLPASSRSMRMSCGRPSSASDWWWRLHRLAQAFAHP